MIRDKNKRGTVNPGPYFQKPFPLSHYGYVPDRSDFLRVKDFISAMKSLPGDAEREKVLREIGDAICLRCGRVTDEVCHCWNDE